MNLLYPAVGVALVWYFFFNKKMSYAPPNSFTLYYMNGCGHCDKIMPVFDEYMSHCPVSCRKVEASQNSEYSVKGYPTFVFTDKNGYATECHARSPEAWNACIAQNQ
jgi:thiol-disulfide isomerase/thioredoxin